MHLLEQVAIACMTIVGLLVLCWQMVVAIFTHVKFS